MLTGFIFTRIIERIGLVVCAFVVSFGLAQAATVTAERDACDPKDCYVIRIDGDIQLEDFTKFDKLIAQDDIKVAVVYLNSDGGNLIGGLLIGYLLNEHGFNTLVPDNGSCVSVCASIWLAGNTKYVWTSAKIGFHQPYRKDRHGHLRVDPKITAFVKKYYARIGVPKPAADFFVAANPADVYWLNGSLARGFGIEVSELEAKKDEANSKPEKAEAQTHGGS
jgi:hypothetical protein